MEETGQIHLSGESIDLTDHEECAFHNQCNSPKDGKFCKGAGGGGRIREIKDPKARAAAEEENKKIAADTEKRGQIRAVAGKVARKSPDKTEEEVIEEANKKIKPGEKVTQKDVEEAVGVRKAAGAGTDDFEPGARKLAPGATKVEGPTAAENKAYLQEVKANAGYYKNRTSGPTQMEKERFADSKSWWAAEEKRVANEIAGKPVARDKIKTGPSVKPPEWPQQDAKREITVQEGPKSFFGGQKFIEVDGHKVTRAYEVTTADGSKLKAYDFGAKPSKDAESMLNQMAAMHELYPTKPAQKLALLDKHQANRLAPGAAGFTFPGDKHIFMNKSAINDTDGAAAGWMMPAAKQKGVKGHNYVMVHEYGHQVDALNKRGSARGLANNKNVRKHMSRYGNSHPAESYAEAFAEWHLTQGKTKNPAAIIYARHEGWYGSKNAVTAAGYITLRDTESSRLDAMDAADAIAVWDGWRIAKELGIIQEFAEKEKEEKDDLTFPKGEPVIIENWKEGATLRNIPKGTASVAEIEEADKIVREVFEELGLDYEE